MIRSNKLSDICKTRKATHLLVGLISLCLVSCVGSNRPKALDVFKPGKSKKDVQVPIPKDRTLTVILISNNKILYYCGDPKKPVESPVLTGYGKDSLDKVLKTEMAAIKDTSQHLIVLIKPSDKSTYKNFTSMIDLVNKCGIKSYGVVDIDSADVALLKKFHAY
jgi:hypothetical protein